MIETIIPLVLIWILFGGIGLFLVSIKKSGEKLLEVEKGKQKQFHLTCGARLNGMNYTSPLIRLSGYEKFMVLGSGQNRYKIDYSEIDKVEMMKGIVSRGVQIHHHNRVAPQKIIIWTGNPENLVTQIDKGRKNTDRNQHVTTA